MHPAAWLALGDRLGDRRHRLAEAVGRIHEAGPIGCRGGRLCAQLLRPLDHPADDPAGHRLCDLVRGGDGRDRGDRLFLFRETLDVVKVVGIGLIIAGVVTLNGVGATSAP